MCKGPATKFSNKQEFSSHSFGLECIKWNEKNVKNWFFSFFGYWKLNTIDMISSLLKFIEI